MNSLIFVIVIILLLVFMFNSVSSSRSAPAPRRRSRKQKRTRTRSTRTRRVQRLSESASDAMKRAGYDAGPDYVQVADIGLLAYGYSREPKMIRSGDVMMDTDYLRPFAELWLPYRANGAVRFELVDSDGRLRYADETEYELARGANMVLPSTWLPMEGKVIQPGKWRLRVLASDTLLAVHSFRWQEVGGGVIQEYVETDGELSPELRSAMQARQREVVSLSDLLSDQDE